MKGTIMGVKAKRIRERLLVATAIGAMMVIAAPVRADDGHRQDYNIEAQSLGDALKTVSRQSGREIIFGAEAVAGKQAPPLHGNYSADEAVRMLLASSDLSAEFRKDVIIIRGRSEPSGGISNRSAEVTDIVVTGSRIRGAQATYPVIRDDRESIERSGLADLGSYARSIPQNFNGGQNPGVAGGGSQGDGNQNLTNSSTLNLRGLGPDATLTLINGHRVAYDAIGQGVDISAIPLAAVDRVEIVADGASALYGSDAVGGVANVILRRDFQGIETSARFGASTDGGNEQQEYSVVSGNRWGTGGFMAALDYSRFTAVTARQRDYTNTLDPSASLIPQQKQFSAVLAGHQRVADQLSFEFDGQFNERKSLRLQPFYSTSDAYSDGNVNSVNVRSFSLAPSLKAEISSDWQATLTATYGESRSEIRSRRSADGAEVNRGFLVYNNRTEAVELTAEGPLFHTAAGGARLAVGGGYRNNHLGVLVKSTSGGVTAVTSDFSGNRDAYYGYGELSLPLIGVPNSVPLARLLQFSAAVRYEDYPSVARLATPKLGIVYKPIDDVTFRASWGKSFKTQTLFQENQLREGYLFPAYFFAPSPLSDDSTVLLVDGGNKNLKPERATTWTATVEAQPRFISGLTLGASYFHVRYRNRVAVPISGLLSALSNPVYDHLVVYSPTATMIGEIVNALPEGLSNQSGAPFDPSNVGAFVDDSLQNAARQRIQGVDLSASYEKDFGDAGKINLAAAASYLESDRQLNPGQQAIQLAGTIFNPPHWRGRAGGSWERGNVGLSAYFSYIGGTNDNRYDPDVHVGAFKTLDLTVRVRSEGEGLAGGFEAILTVLNALNEKPSIIRNADPADPPYDSTNYSVAGRVVALTLTKHW